MPTLEKQVYTVKEVADALGVSRETARLILKKEPGVIRVEGRGAGDRSHLRTPAEVLARLLRRMTGK